MTIRPATRSELRAAHDVRLATWQVAYRGIVPDDYLDSLALTADQLARFEERFDQGLGTTLVAVEASEVVGMAVHGPCRDEDRGGEHELYAVYVLPSHWGAGAGQELLDACVGVTSLWVLEGNARARAFYERNGFRPDVTTTIDLGVPLVEVRYLLG